MSELKEAAKKELFSKLSGHSLANLTSGAREIAVIDKRIQKETLTKYLKRGWILESDLDENYDTIVRWERVKDFINDTRREIRRLEADIPSMREQIADVEAGGKWDAWKSMLPRYREILENDLKALSVNRQKLEKAKVEFKPLKAVIKSLKDKFKLYISQLERARSRRSDRVERRQVASKGDLTELI